MISLISRRSGLMSISAISASARAGRCRMSPTMFFMNTEEPAPIKVILGRAMFNSDRKAFAALASGSDFKGGADEPGRILVLGICQNLGDRALFDDLAMLHDDHA